MNREIQSLAKKLAELIEEKTGRTCAVVAITGDEDYARLSPDALFDGGVRVEPGHEAKLLNLIR
ncbi:hypothetical protein [Pseudoduganella sp. R-34]|uniref:hypothetical protein n=1 Tax=Pseudoduganella sp. R-34 TaxID=3404062 RepID=UPI003CFB4BC0